MASLAPKNAERISRITNEPPTSETSKCCRLVKHSIPPFCPQESLKHSSFFQLLARESGTAVREADHQVPLFGRRSLIFSTESIPETSLQFVVSPRSGLGVTKSYFSKPPLKSESHVFSGYSRGFRRNVRRAQKLDVTTTWMEGASVPPGHRRHHFELHVAAARVKKTFHLPWAFFDGLFDITGQQVLLCSAFSGKQPLGFQLLIGNVAYVSATHPDGRHARVSNAIYHAVYERFYDRWVHLGSAFRESGTERFKRDSGALPFPIYVHARFGLYEFAREINKRTWLRHLCTSAFQRAVQLYPRLLLNVMPYG